MTPGQTYPAFSVGLCAVEAGWAHAVYKLAVRAGERCPAFLRDFAPQPRTL